MTAPTPTPVPVYPWRVQRGEPGGLLCPVHDAEGDPTDPQPWTATAVVRPEPGDPRVLHTFAGTGIEVRPAGVHLHLTAAETRAAVWRRGWLEVMLTDPRTPTETAMVVRGPLTLTD